jgi:hypothetical protein
MLDFNICKKCWDDALGIKHHRINSNYPWPCRVFDSLGAISVNSGSTPPAGCLRLFEQAIAMSLKKTEEENVIS